VDPFRLYNDLDESYRPLRAWDLTLYGEEPDPDDDAPVRPPHPDRLRAFIYACGLVAENEPAKTLTVQPRSS
jgi:hypothetical protein